MADTVASDLTLLTRVLDSLPDYIWICDSALRETVYISLACERLLGVPRDELLGDCRLLLRWSMKPIDAGSLKPGAAQPLMDTTKPTA